MLKFSCNCLQCCIQSINIFPHTGASAAAMLIFILPSAFYIKLVKKESMKSVQKIGVSAEICRDVTELENLQGESSNNI